MTIQQLLLGNVGAGDKTKYVGSNNPGLVAVAGVLNTALSSAEITCTLIWLLQKLLLGVAFVLQARLLMQEEVNRVYVLLVILVVGRVIRTY